jgi:hypothetical protein
MAMKNASVKHNSNGLLLELLEYGDIVKAISSAIYHPGSMYLGAWIVANHFKWFTLAICIMRSFIQSLLRESYFNIHSTTIICLYTGGVGGG